MTRTETISIRATAGEKMALSVAADSRGCSLASFLLTAATQEARREIEYAGATLSTPIEPIRARSKEARPIDTEFRTPFMQRRYAAGFEEVVRYAARGVRTDEHTVAILMTYLAEGIGNLMAAGGVFRWPGLLVAGAYRIERGCRESCAPRFQANPPLRNHIELFCPPERARNRELDAHRRRRRPERCGALNKVMLDMRQGIMRQDKRICDQLESNWREGSSLHYS